MRIFLIFILIKISLLNAADIAHDEIDSKTQVTLAVKKISLLSDQDFDLPVAVQIIPDIQGSNVLINPTTTHAVPVRENTSQEEMLFCGCSFYQCGDYIFLSLQTLGRSLSLISCFCSVPRTNR